MAITWNKPERIDDLAWRLSWSSDAATPVTFRVYREGHKIATIRSPDGKGELIVSIGVSEHPFFEVLDKDCALAGIAFPGRLTVHWQESTGADKYRVEELISGVWTLRAEIRDDGLGAFSWISRWLEDVTNHQFRVIPVDSTGNQGSALSFAALMVRHPDVPNVKYTVNANRTLLIESA